MSDDREANHTKTELIELMILHCMCMCALCLREFSFIPTAADDASHEKKAARLNF